MSTPVPTPPADRESVFPSESVAPSGEFVMDGARYTVTQVTARTLSYRASDATYDGWKTWRQYTTTRTVFDRLASAGLIEIPTEPTAEPDGAGRVRPSAVYEIDQRAINAPCFPRPIGWWQRFLPIWVTPIEGPGATIRVAVEGRQRGKALGDYLTNCAGGRLAAAVRRLDRDAVGLIQRGGPLVGLAASPSFDDRRQDVGG